MLCKRLLSTIVLKKHSGTNKTAHSQRCWNLISGTKMVEEKDRLLQLSSDLHGCIKETDQQTDRQTGRQRQRQRQMHTQAQIQTPECVCMHTCPHTHTNTIVSLKIYQFRWEEIIKSRAGTNKIETKKTIQSISETKFVLQDKSTKQTNLYPN